MLEEIPPTLWEPQAGSVQMRLKAEKPGKTPQKKSPQGSKRCEKTREKAVTQEIVETPKRSVKSKRVQKGTLEGNKGGKINNKSAEQD